MERTGNCFDACGEMAAQNEHILGREFKLVHGLPTGTSGHAAKAGQYPHAWIEVNFGETPYCFDLVAEQLVRKEDYYRIGQIKYAIKYTRDEAKAMMVEHGTYGPWDQKLLDRDAEIDQMIQEA